MKKPSHFLFLLLLGLLISTFTLSSVKADWGSQPTQLTANSAPDENPSISDDGTKIAFQSEVEGDYEIFVINSDGTGLTQLTSNTADDMFPSISDDGTKIAFHSDADGDYEIFVVNSDGSGLTQLTFNTVNDTFPCISGDGTKIAYISDEGRKGEIFVINFDGSGSINLTKNSGRDTYPSISDDGTRIAYMSYREYYNWEIFVVNSDGSGLTQLTTSTEEGHSKHVPSISGDGTKISYHKNSPDVGNEVFVINFDGSGLIQLTSNTAREGRTSISDDGSKITFSVVDDDWINCEIWVVNSDGSGLTQLVSNIANLYNLCISGDGTKIAYSSDVDGDFEIFIISLDTSPPEASFTYSPVDPQVNDVVTFDASGSNDPDGTIVTYSWNFGDENTAAGTTTNHSYDSEGTYSVTLTVTDNDGLTNVTTKTITVKIPVVNGNGDDVTPPVANAGNDMTANAGSKVSFSGAGSSDNVGIVTYEWNFGDGNTGTGITPTHTYETEGTYTVTLKVIDAAENYDTATIVVNVGPSTAAEFPFWILIPIIIAIVAFILLWFFFFRKKKPEKKEPKPVKVRVTAEPSELLADGKTKSAITVELLDADGNPVPAPDNTEIKLTTTKGRIEQPIVKISKGKEKEQTLLVSPKEGGKATLSANVGDLGSTSVTVTFLEKTRYCMHCGSKMSFAAKNCPVCGKSPPAGVDTQSCKKCNAVIPNVANFCAECGARQLK